MRTSAWAENRGSLSEVAKMRSSAKFGGDRIVAAAIVITMLVILGMFLNDSWEFPFP